MEFASDGVIATLEAERRSKDALRAKLLDAESQLAEAQLENRRIAEQFRIALEQSKLFRN